MHFFTFSENCRDTALLYFLNVSVVGTKKKKKEEKIWVSK